MTAVLRHPRLWITGAGGLIGHQIVRQAPLILPDWQVIPLHRATLDLLDSTAVAHRFRADCPDAIIHAAGLTLSRDCTAQPELARRLNVDVTAHLAQLAHRIPLVFFSTDLVFDGSRGNYREEDTVNPLSVYGQTKAAAEQHVLANPRHCVIRTSLNFGESPRGHRAFNEEMLDAWQAGRILTLFTDEFRCPIAAEITAQAVLHLVRTGALDTKSDADSRPRIFHLAGTQRMSRWELGQVLLSRHPEFRPLVRPGSLHDYHGDPRPPDTSLCCDKLQRLLPFALPAFATWFQQRT